MRIVSLLPSATEICFALGAGDEVVGVTFECDYPAAARTRRIVSTTALPLGLTPAEIDAEVRARVAAGEDLYKLDADLNPTHVITQDLCAVCALDVADVESALDYLGCTAEVVTTNPHTLYDVLTSIEQIAKALDRDPPPLLDDLRDRLQNLADREPTGRRVGLLEWTDPPYAPGHWLPEQVELAGGVNVLGTTGGRSHPVEWSALAGAEVVVVAPCGFGVQASYELAKGLDELPPGAEVWAVDSNSYFARPGPRLVDGIELLADLLAGHTPNPTKARRLP